MGKISSIPDICKYNFLILISNCWFWFWFLLFQSLYMERKVYIDVEVTNTESGGTHYFSSEIQEPCVHF